MPEKDVFWNGMKKLEKWYRGKELTDDQLNMWLESIGHIPNEPFRLIIKEITDSEKWFPTPEKFKTKWFEWLKLNPDRVFRTREQCSECNGEGALEYWLWKTGSIYGYHCGCAKCENWRNVFPTQGKNMPKLMTKEEIIAMGGSLDDPDRPPRESRRVVNSVEEAVDIAVNDIPF